ncbi:raffinose/stachyose/melibiose transport system substrate-binding protein [Hydrogenoanaerobacterium saccharovorans]|uniref:Raffinose/stachyose/melibiose transport system substrate-binding protein n=1 Tax=Hydrogenoanaerobacterium saccharovorans TaxID=474960 RepID=A0A1H7ZFD2_9FIRM|nr:extracellular solute-binding protein [Hydrogenoanaerobacterium saccharovorans]RPF48630.1 raffinose/stachyose/melibiose transport system substrate-binding protein [Hydrogenoanaerobacterium saccharovorans]SEM57100.1 raffinose/stachyose/melibiose transport system substrate-binding protein [Hydrogenoanaerobacterium saccharovorans]
MKKRFMSFMCLVLVAAMLFSGCAGKSTSSNGNATSPAGEKVKLVYWSMWNETEPQGQTLSEAIKAYSNKTGVEVEVNWNGRDIRKTLQPALDGGTAIDLFDEDVERVNDVWGNYLLDVEEMAAKSYEATGGKPFTDVVSKTLVDLARSLGPNGKLSTIPYQPSTFIVMYNKDIFAEAGITSVPKNWTEFLDACEKIKKTGKTAITVDDAYMAALMGYHMDRLIGLDETLKIVEKNDFSNPAVLEFGKQWQEMAQKGYISKNAAANIYPAGQQEIANGSVAMYLNGTWLPNEIKDSAPADFKWGSFAYPAVAEAGDGPEANNFGAQCFGINKNSKHPQEAFDLIVWLTTGEWDAKLAENSVGVPMGNESKWPDQLADAKAVLDSTTKRMPWAVGMENNPDINAKIKTNFALLINGKLDAQGFAEAMKK